MGAGGGLRRFRRLGQYTPPAANWTFSGGAHAMCRFVGMRPGASGEVGISEFTLENGSGGEKLVLSVELGSAGK